MLVWRSPIQIAETRATLQLRRGSRGIVIYSGARVADTYYIVKIAELPKKAPPAADLQGSAGPPRVTNSFTNRKIKLRRPCESANSTLL
jgi:hypothetical protein